MVSAPRPPELTVVGRIEGEYDPPAEALCQQFAVVEVSGKQFKVTPRDVIFAEVLKGVDINDKIRLERVLLIGDRERTVIGRPFVPGAAVVAAVEEFFKEGKRIVFKKKRRKGYKRFHGPRASLTVLRILDIDDGSADDAPTQPPGGDTEEAQAPS